MSDKNKSKAKMLYEFMKANPEMSQIEVREYFKRHGVTVHPSETSRAAKEAGLRPTRDKPGRPMLGPAGKVVTIPVSEAPVMAKKIQQLRKKNEKLRQMIDLLIDVSLDEEVDALKE